MVSQNEARGNSHYFLVSNEKCVYKHIQDKCENCALRGIDCSAASKTLGPKQAKAIISTLEEDYQRGTESPAVIIARYEEQERIKREELVRNYFATHQSTCVSGCADNKVVRARRRSFNVIIMEMNRVFRAREAIYRAIETYPKRYDEWRSLDIQERLDSSNIDFMTQWRLHREAPSVFLPSRWAGSTMSYEEACRRYWDSVLPMPQDYGLPKKESWIASDAGLCELENILGNLTNEFFELQTELTRAFLETTRVEDETDQDQGDFNRNIYGPQDWWATWPSIGDGAVSSGHFSKEPASHYFIFISDILLNGGIWYEVVQPFYPSSRKRVSLRFATSISLRLYHVHHISVFYLSNYQRCRRRISVELKRYYFTAQNACRHFQRVFDTDFAVSNLFNR